MLFGRSKPQSKVVLLLDVEQGSVGGALLRTTPGQPPKLFGELRVALRVMPTRDAQSLLGEATRGVQEVLAHAAHLLARLRHSPATGDMGELSHVGLFLGAPWGVPNLSSGTPQFMSSMRLAVSNALNKSLGDVPVSLYTALGGVHAGAARLIPTDSYLLSLVGGEVTELLNIVNGEPVGYATAPAGRHTIARTLRAHGLSAAEASSAIKVRPAILAEPINLAAEHWAGQVAHAAAPLVARAPVSNIYVVSHALPGEDGAWFAKTLSASEPFAALFAGGGEVRSLLGRHAAPYIAAHAEQPDIVLLLQALYSDALFYNWFIVRLLVCVI